VATYRRVLKTSCRRLVSAAWSSWTLKSYSSLPSSSASGLPKCDVSHLVDLRSALCSSASVTCRYLVTRRHDIPLPSHPARSQHVTTSTQVGLRAVCMLHNITFENLRQMLTQILRWTIWQRHRPRPTISVLALGQVHYELISSVVTWKSGLLDVKRG
jgi:hypothetical protein